METATLSAPAAGGRGACDVISTGRGRRRSVASQRAASLSPALRLSGSQQPACFTWLSARVGSRGDGRRSGRLVVGEPAGRHQQPRYPPARPPACLPRCLRAMSSPQPPVRAWQLRWAARRRGAGLRELQSPRAQGRESLSQVKREGPARRLPVWRGPFPSSHFHLLNFFLETTWNVFVQRGSFA